MMEHKSFAVAEVKATDGDVAGSFEAVVSVFGNVDSYGDRMVKGAFSRTLAEKGMPPVVWSHEWGIPPIGTVSEASETDEGLLIKGRLFVAPDEDHAVARQVYTAMKAGALKEFSFGYFTTASKEVKENGETVREITDVDLFEVGPTLVAANDATRLVGIKAAKAGRVLSKANEDQLRQAAQMINEVLSQVDLAEKTLATENFALTKGLADVLGDYIVGKGIEGRGTTVPVPRKFVDDPERLTAYLEAAIRDSKTSPDLSGTPAGEVVAPELTPADAGQEPSARIAQLLAEQPSIPIPQEDQSE